MDFACIELFGRSASMGIAVGRARVVPKALEAQESLDLAEGDILIAHNITPDMIVDILGAKGIVAEVGGATSHAATIARELNIPCVVNVSDLLGMVVSGELVEVDGTEGRVRVWHAKNDDPAK
jgi:phosphoenolpyruvate synthase/pyruvate phosphate dikinase